MGMDLVRSCYSTFMSFWRDKPEVRKVTWFFVDDNAKVFPHHHRFGSGNWASDRFDWPGPGELLGAPREWVDGHNPGELTGQKFCGPIEAYTHGATSDMPPLKTNAVGICCCCTCVCECDDLIERFEERMFITITAVTPGAGPVRGMVGERFELSARVNWLGKKVWDTDWIGAAGPFFTPFKFEVLCFDWIGFGRLLSQGRIFYPDTEPTEWLIWFKEECEPQYIGTITDAWIDQNPFNREAWSIKLTATYQRDQ